MGHRTRYQKHLLSIALAFAPVVAFAALEPDTNQGSGLFELLGRAVYTLNLAIPLSISFALFCFLWGIGRFIWNANSEDGRERGKQFMIWGVIALFVIVSVWGIVGLLSDVFEVGISGKCRAPSITGDTVESCGF